MSWWYFLILYLSASIYVLHVYPRTPHLSPLLVGVEVGVAAPDDALRVTLGLHVAVRRRPGQAGRGEGVLTSEHDHQVSAVTRSVP